MIIADCYRIRTTWGLTSADSLGHDQSVVVLLAERGFSPKSMASLMMPGVDSGRTAEARMAVECLLELVGELFYPYPGLARTL